jgi:hypothetical protein
MKKGVVVLIAISVICVSMSGAAVSVTKSVSKNVDIENKEFIINQPTESPEVNTQLLNRINEEVDKYLNIEEYNSNIINYINKGPQEKTQKEVTFPWSINEPLSQGDILQWVIRVHYGEKYFEKEIDISPKDFRERFLKHPLHYEYVYFDVDENGEDDLKVFYSVFTSTILNTIHDPDIEVSCLKTCLKVDAGDIPDRYERLEVWSEIKLNYGLIPRSKDLDRPLSFNGKFKSLLENFIEKLQNKFENTRFTLIKKLLNLISGRLQQNTDGENSEPDIEVLAADDDWLSAGIGIGSPEGEKTPIFFEKRFAFAKKNIFSPIIFEHELKQIQSTVPLELLFGFKAGKGGTSNPTFDIAFLVEFDPAIYICTQFIPLGGYIYYFWDVGSAHSTETRISFSANILKGSGDDTELTLIFDDTNPLASSSNWFSFDIQGLGFEYKANKKHNIGVLVTSPIFSAKLKLVSFPSQITCGFDVDLSLEYQQDVLFDTEAIGSLNLDMSSDLDDVILYYPELGPDEPKIELVKISGVPKSQSLSVNAHLRIQNGSEFVTLMGEGYVDFTMSSDLDRVQVFYRKADPYDPDKLFIDVPYGIPRSQRVGAKAELKIDLDNFTNLDNYVFGRIYRTSSGNLQEIDGYLPGETEPIVRITEIPANSEAKGKLEWNKLKGYAYADRQSAGAPDPIEINVDIGTFNIYNYLEIQDGHIDCDFHLAENGYFGFDTANDMIGDTLRVTDTSSGNQLSIDVYKVSAEDLWVDWVLDMSQTPIPIEELAITGDLSLLEDFIISATYQGQYLEFEGDWQVGKEGIFSLDFNQDEPIELILDDLFPNDPKFTLGGGVIISEDFHFDMKWNWEEGQSINDPGWFKINEDTNDPNFDWIGIYFTYTPDGYTDPQFGIEIGGNDIGLIVWVKWYDDGFGLPEVWWYVYIMGNFYADLLWNGVWYQNIHTW